MRCTLPKRSGPKTVCCHSSHIAHSRSARPTALNLASNGLYSLDLAPPVGIFQESTPGISPNIITVAPPLSPV